ncbi:MAG: hypothetical protein ACYC57_08220 [Thermoleophilia bacterium]
MEMMPKISEGTANLASQLVSYNAELTIAKIAGLLTVPRFLSNTIRIEFLAHLAVAFCNGNKDAKNKILRRWLNHELAGTQISMMEDPAEDVFITNVLSPFGNYRIFEANWNHSAYYLQSILDAFLSTEPPEAVQSLLVPILSLLKVGDQVAERLDLPRWVSEESNAHGEISISKSTKIEKRSAAVTFSSDDLKKLNIDIKKLEPFILDEENRKKLNNETTGNSSLERYPLVPFEDKSVLALPHAVSPAIRRYFLSELDKVGYLRQFEKIFMDIQADQVVDVFRNLDIESLPQPKQKGPLPELHSWLFKYDENKYLHVLLIHDHLSQINKNGLDSSRQFTDKEADGLWKYITTVINQCQKDSEFIEGITLVILGGLGRGYYLPAKDLPERWYLSVLNIADLCLLEKDDDQPIKLYLKYIKQKKWAENNGVKFINMSGDINLFCYWRENKYQLITDDMPLRLTSMVLVENDYVFPFRKKIRSLVDSHVVQTANGNFVRVERLGRDSYFNSMRERPIFASPDLIVQGILAGVVETKRGATWLIAPSNRSNEDVHFMVYEIWHGFIGLFNKLVEEIESNIGSIGPESIEIHLDLSKLTVPDVPFDTSTRDEINLEGAVNIQERKAIIQFPADYLSYFQQEENFGELITVQAMAKALLGLHLKGEEIVQEIVDQIVTKVIGSEATRVLHLFQTFQPAEHLIAKHSHKATFLAEEDIAFARLGISEGCTSNIPGIISERESCNEFTKKIVVKYWEQIRERLKQHDRTSVLKRAIEVHEAIIQDRDEWRRTAQAVIALYSPGEDAVSVAHKRDLKRNQTAIPARTIMEMAICECPVEGGRTLSGWDLDELLALTALMLESASDSDAIYTDLAKPQIKINKNGSFAADRSYYESFILPFVRNFYREEFVSYADAYGKLYEKEKPSGSTRMSDLYSKEFNDAFGAEFGLTADEAVEGFSELLDLSVELKSVIVKTSLGELRQLLISKRGLSPNACKSFFKAFSLFHRPKWDEPPEGFKQKDLNPWRFRRRLSATVRPLLIYGDSDNDTVLFGAGGLWQSFGYIFDRIEQGQLPGTFFTSKEMKSYIGAVNDERGHDFAKSTAKSLSELGWSVQPEVKMTELGAPAQLGDIDVLAWKENGGVLLVECKRLQQAMTIAEIAEICRRFSGEAKDELDKHVQRLNWVLKNRDSLKAKLGFTPEEKKIEPRLITNTHVPMRYLESLPISQEYIGTISQLMR